MSVMRALFSRLLGLIYHMKFKPPPADIAGRLTQRSDDTEEKVAYCQPVTCFLF